MFEQDVYGEVFEEERTGTVVKKHTCDSCGGSFCTDLDQSEAECIFCGSHSISSQDYVEAKFFRTIPFVKGIEDAKKSFRKKVMANPLIPFSFKSKKRLLGIRKAFLPALLVNVNQSGQILFLGGEKNNVVQNRKRCVEIKKYDVFQTVNIDYNKILMNASSKINDRIFTHICEYDYDQLQDFDFAMLKDASYVLGDIPVIDLGNKGRDKISKHTLNLVRDNVKHPLRKLKQDNSSIQFHNAREVLVPVYFLSIPFNKKNYVFLMNGETGKCYIELPVSFVSTFLFSLLIFGIVFLLAYLVAVYL